MSRRLTSLAWSTAIFTYVLMVWGNMVSSTGSGDACPDWPLCHGSIFPPLQFNIMIEWGHRLLASVTGVMILMTAFTVWRSSRTTPELKGATRTILILLFAQILLGGTTVLLKLSPTVSTIHLIVATLVFSGVITVAAASTFGNDVQNTESPKLRRLATYGLGALLVQFVLGAFLRHLHAGLSCPNYPSCGESFWPLPFQLETSLAFLHRWWGTLLLGLFVHLEIVARKQARSQLRLTQVIVFLAFTQVSLGISTVLSNLDTATRGIHAACGYALWGLMFYLALRTGAFRWAWQQRQQATTNLQTSL